MLGGTAAKNGNISQAIWRVRGRERQAYVYSYDYLNRLSAATYRGLTDANAISNDNAWNEGAGYDIRGNITNLGRGGRTLNGACWQDGIIDFLAYEYYPNSNRLRRITDNAPAATKTEGWHNTRNAPATAEYSYDANGNMISDPYKGMTVTYNYLNLPTQMLFTNGSTQQKIEILYAGNGQKIRKTVSTNNVLGYRQDYLGGIEYKSTATVNLSLESIAHAEGRVYNTNTGTTSADALRYEYAIKDHLGNLRLMFTDKNANGKVDVTNTVSNEILQESHYYAFGLEMRGPWMEDAAAVDNLSKYNSKELNTDFGLGWYDYGARWYDAAVARWWAIDPAFEKYISWSPFSFVANKPNQHIEIDGRQWVNPYFVEAHKLLTEMQKKGGEMSEADANRLGQLNEKGEKVKKLLTDLDKSDPELYKYIDNLTIFDVSAQVDVPVNVSVFLSYDNINDENGADGVTAYQFAEADDKYTYNGKGFRTISPTYSDDDLSKFDMARKDQKRGLGNGFYIMLYESGKNTSTLANEAGDVMYVMEYNEDAYKKRRSNSSGYWSQSATQYSYAVEKAHEQIAKGTLSGDVYPLIFKNNKFSTQNGIQIK